MTNEPNDRYLRRRMTVLFATVLRRGTVVALPLLEAMAARACVPAAAGKRAAVAPRRMAFIYVPNGVHMDDWTPAKEGRDFELPADPAAAGAASATT